MGNYLFSFAVVYAKKEFMTTLQTGDLAKKVQDNGTDNAQLRDINEAIRQHPTETVGKTLRGYRRI